MAKIIEDERTADFGNGPRSPFLFSFTLGLGEAAAAGAAEGFSPSFSFCFTFKLPPSNIQKSYQKAFAV